jgi:rhodanese-related sulfurtransferase
LCKTSLIVFFLLLTFVKKSPSMKKLLFLLLLAAASLTSCQSQNQTASENEVVLSVEKYQAKLAEMEGVQLLDVRTPKEYEDGHIEGAVNIDYFDESFLSQVEQRFDKDQPVMLYCRSGNRSAKATAIMKEAGFKEIYDLKGGFMQWSKE